MKAPKMAAAALLFTFGITAAVSLYLDRSGAALKLSALGDMVESQPLATTPSEIEAQFSAAETLSPRLPAPRTRQAVAVYRPPGNQAPTVVTGTYFEDSSPTAVSAGLDVGFSYVLPFVKVQGAINDHWTIGAHFTYVENIFGGPKAAAIGGGLSATYFLSGKAFRGTFIDFGMAAYKMTTTTIYRSSLATPMALSMAAGWTEYVGSNLSVTIAAGGQYVHNFSRNIGDVLFDGPQPLLRFGLGYEF